MIIGTSGYAGSGKDTVGKIIQLLSCTNLDKDIQDVLDNYEDNKWWIEEQSSWEIKKWAGKLKEIASLLTGIPVEKFEDQEFKKTYLGPEWNYWTVSAMSEEQLLFRKGRLNTKEEAEEYRDSQQFIYGTFGMQYVVGMNQMTVRQFLQELGTDGLRDGLHPNVWVNALMADYTPVTHSDRDPGGFVYPNWIITDTRFVNEAQAIKKQGGIVIRVERPGVKAVNGHPSEVGLEGYDFDYVITNDGTIEDLIPMVKEVLSQANII